MENFSVTGGFPKTSQVLHNMSILSILCIAYLLYLRCIK
jgi:hypothetical protein